MHKKTELQNNEYKEAMQSLIFCKSQSKIKTSLANEQRKREKVFIGIFTANFMNRRVRE